MSNKIHKVTQNIRMLPHFAKQSVALILDFSLCVASTWLAFYLRLDQFVLIQGVYLTAAILSVFLA